MPGPKKVGTLQVEEDLDFQRREWRVQRVGWVVVALLLLATLLGLTGPGPLSRATAGSEGAPLRAEYNRFGRHHAPGTVRFELSPEAVRDGKAKLWVSRSYLETVQVDSISPEPESVQAGADRLTYTFDVGELDRPTKLTFHIEPEDFGLIPARAGLEGGPELTFSQFVYP